MRQIYNSFKSERSVRALRSICGSWLCLVLTFLCVSNSFAQQEATFTNYLYNELAINPAVAGNRDGLFVSLLHRSQWVGFPGAPTTQSLNAHSSVYGDAVNLGITLINDKTGIVHDRSVFLDYAYRFYLSEKSQLSLGLKVGFRSMSADLTDLTLAQAGDAAFAKDIATDIYPNFGFGLYFTSQRFFAGFSIPRLVENSDILALSNGNKLFSKEYRHYYLNLGANFDLNESFQLKPSVFAKATKGNPFQVDLTANVVYQEKFLVGLMYRTGDALGILAGIYISPRFYVGYSFDWSFLNSTPKYNYGSHELVLQYEFLPFNKNKIRSPRYF